MLESSGRCEPGTTKGESDAARGTMNIQGPKIDTGPGLRRGRRQNSSSAAYSLIELMLVVAIAMVLGAMAIPQARSAIASYELAAAVDSASGAIQTTRYQAIMHGYPYQVAFSSANKTF